MYRRRLKALSTITSRLADQITTMNDFLLH